MVFHLYVHTDSAYKNEEKKDEVDAVSVDNSMGAVLLYVVALDHWNDWS